MTVRGLELESIAINQNTMSANLLFELITYKKQTITAKKKNISLTRVLNVLISSSCCFMWLLLWFDSSSCAYILCCVCPLENVHSHIQNGFYLLILITFIF